MPKRTTSRPNSASSYSELTGRTTAPAKADKLTDHKPTRKPDWLLIFVSILFLLSLLIVWLVDVPSLLR
ncbi:hypothetical protein [Spirosoma linguale]|uniref:Uncharacterized protein n=1 Tax=Spirosoma linguale (strain ATCC 33905 / DSM 74 / LMG 10896 / Claus 1) TaxID=504472 RepID=D2QQJ2_SPILD|nr:hypothetical protein Slin_4795 [Spirosoma linguale DSM 74]